jgi:hypothetical protein
VLPAILPVDRKCHQLARYGKTRKSRGDSQLHMLVKTLWLIYETSQETVGRLDLLWAELRDGGGLEMFVEQLARMFPPLVVRRETKRPTEAHTVNAA